MNPPAIWIRLPARTFFAYSINSMSRAKPSFWSHTTTMYRAMPAALSAYAMARSRAMSANERTLAQPLAAHLLDAFAPHDPAGLAQSLVAPVALFAHRPGHRFRRLLSHCHVGDRRRSKF